MMSPWAWYWKHAEDEVYGEECASREAVIAAAEKELVPGEPFEIVEARMSEARQHWESDYIPFLRIRNHESITVGQTTTAAETGAVGTETQSVGVKP
jgi:hypothetical protein